MSNNRPHNGNNLPAGWLDCPSCGHPIGWLLPSKVPLGESFNTVIPQDKRYSLRHVIHQQHRLGRHLGMVIDLTNTDRYYHASDWGRQGIKHVKIRCKGRNDTPDTKSVNDFVYKVSNFISCHNNGKKFILVHCTHGHNRTGFMIVHYLMRTQAISVGDAIHVFSGARSPGIYKQDYLDALFSFYHERRPQTLICPSTPEWKRSSGPSTPERKKNFSFDLNADAVMDEVPNVGYAAQLRVDNGSKMMANDDVLGDVIPLAQERELRSKCYQLLKLTRGDSGFPGSHPVSLNRENTQMLRQRYYYATWKADGTRYMMLITRDGCYLIDRKFTFRRVQMRFPLKQSKYGQTHHLTLLDGEMVIDVVPQTKEQVRRYLAYDLMAINGVSITEEIFQERYKLLEEEVIKPRNDERKNINVCKNPNYRYELEPFSVRVKHFYFLSTVPKLLSDFINGLCHAVDGLIFQGWDDPYVAGPHPGLLKWKFPEMNSVYFLFVIEDGCEKLFLLDGGHEKLMEDTQVRFGETFDAAVYSGKIIECSWDMEQKLWMFMRVRVDKSKPNGVGTYNKVVKSIMDNINKEDLLKEIEHSVSLPMYVDRMLLTTNKR